jgi:GNAT superfamily N-acetyltransferase
MFDRTKTEIAVMSSNSLPMVQFPYFLPFLRKDTLQLSRLSNALIYLHPFFLALWGAALAVIYRYTRIFQKRDWGRGLLLLCCITSFFLVAVEWYNRTYWEKKTKALLDADATLKDIPKHYGKDRFLVATLGDDMLIGLVGLQVDGRIATVKHWHVKGKYRSRGLGWDLLQWVIEVARKGGKKGGSLQKVRCQTYNLQRRAEKTLKDHGFVRVGKTVVEPGLLGWFGVRLNTWEKTL